MISLSKEWEECCNDYVRAFMEKHEYEYDIESDISNNLIWVGNDPGTIACIGEMFIHMDTIRYDIDNDIPKNIFEKWYWKSVDEYTAGHKYMDYQEFCEGPKLKDDDLDTLKELVKIGKIEFEKAVDNYIKACKKHLNK